MSQREERIRARLDAAAHPVPLASLFSDSRGTPAQRLRAFVSACYAIGRAHAVGIVHRDLRPATILIGETWDAEIAGWDHAFVPGEPSPLDAAPTTYSAPELTATTSDPRADIYSLGVILRELLGPVAVPPELHEVAQIASAREPERRILKANQLGDHVLEFLEGVRNWELRRGIAAEHLAIARTATDEGRHEAAIGEAWNALKLDPGSRPAADIVIGAGRVPKEIAQLIEIEQNYGLRDTARIGIWAYFGYLLFAPAFLWLAAGETGSAIGMLVLVALNIGLLAVHGYTQVRLHEIWFVIGNALLIGFVARISSPFLLAPGIAALTATALAMSPTYLAAPIVNTMIGCLVAAILLPWIAEWVGWITPTTTIVSDGILLQAPSFRVREGGQLMLLVFYVVTLLTAAGWLAFALMRRERRLRYRTYLQLWQMRENLTQAAR
jgi:hypothetical protein